MRYGPPRTDYNAAQIEAEDAPAVKRKRKTDAQQMADAYAEDRGIAGQIVGKRRKFDGLDRGKLRRITDQFDRITKDAQNSK